MRTECDHRPRPGDGQIHQPVPGEILVFAAQQQDQRLVVTAHGGQHPLRRSGDAVVDPGHALPHAHHFQAVGDAAEAPDRRRQRLRRDARRPGNGARRQRVQDVVRAAQGDLRPGQHGLRPAVRAGCAAHHQSLAGQISAVNHGLARAEPDHPPRRQARQPRRAGIVAAQDRQPIRPLKADQVRFGGRIRFQRPVPVEMVRRDIEDSPQRRAGRRQLKLKAAQFHDHHVGWPDGGQHVQQHVADVAADMRHPPGGAAHRPDQRGGCRLAGAAGDADRPRRAAGQEKLGVVGHGHAAPQGFRHQWSGQRHAAGDAQHIRVIEQAKRMAAQDKGHAVRAVGRQALAKGRLRPGIGDRHPRADRRQPAGQRLPLPGEAHHHHALA